MVALSALWLPLVLSAVAVFMVSAVVHMVLKYHKADFKRIPNQDQVLAKAVWFQPQTSNGESMSFKIGLSFEQMKDEVLDRIRTFLGHIRPAGHAGPVRQVG